ncbi:MAG TPA: hypothetical protein VK464_10345 [Symbiobacteriaceae bacterium]|jgi:hypothetical protein|nr:hypothetical protein [Symbiobacteriaceae bacterium]
MMQLIGVLVLWFGTVGALFYAANRRITDLEDRVSRLEVQIGMVKLPSDKA